jgi:hypothetical protein
MARDIPLALRVLFTFSEEGIISALSPELWQRSNVADKTYFKAEHSFIGGEMYGNTHPQGSDRGS